MNFSEGVTQPGLPDSSKVLDLSELAAKYADSVPFRFQVVNGFMAENEKDPTLGVDEVYSVHLVREIKVVTVKVDNDYRFKVPVTSAAKFGLVPDKDIVTYNGVEAIMSRPQLPKVLAVRSTYANEDETLRLKKDEILLVRGLAKGKFGRSKTGLRVFSMSSYGEIILPKTCDVKFSTDPVHTQLYLTDLIENKVDFVPCFARIFPGTNSSLAKSLTASSVAIESLEVHRSVIVSLFRDNPSAKRRVETSFIDIPTTININVSIIGTDKSDKIYERIFLESEHLLADYNPSKIQACLDASTNDEYMTQAQLLAEIRKEKVAAEIASSAPHQYQKLLPVKKEIQSYETVSFPAKPVVPSQPEPLPEAPQVATARGQKAQKPKTSRSQKHEETIEVSVPPQSSQPKTEPAVLIPEPLPALPFKAQVPEPKPALPFKTQVPEPKPALPFKTEVPQPKPARPFKAEVPEPKPALPFKAQAKHKPPPPPIPKKEARLPGDIYDDVLNSPPPQPLSTSSNKPVPAKRTSAGNSSHAKRDHLYEDLDSWKPPRSSGQASTDYTVAVGASREEVAQARLSPNPRYDRIKPGISNSETPSAVNINDDDNYIKFTKPSQNGADSSGTAEFTLLANQLNKLQATMLDIVNRLNQLEERQTNFERELSQLKRNVPKDEAPNITISSSMGPAEVLRTLHAAGLSQYSESFSREVVDGEMFQMLDEQMLSEELGVKSRLHQVRLLRMKTES